MACLSFTAILTSVVVAVLETVGIIMCCRLSDEIGTSLSRTRKSLIENIKKLRDTMAKIEAMRSQVEINEWISEVEKTLKDACLVLLPESNSSSDMDDQESCCCLGYHERVPCELQRKVEKLIVKGEDIVEEILKEGLQGPSSTAPEFLGGPAVRAAFKELFAAIQDAIETISMFRSLFVMLEATCEAMKPFISDIEWFNKILDFPPKELKRIYDLMKEGNKLVTDCSKLHSMETYLKNYYATELVKLDLEMKRFVLIYVVAIGMRNVKGASVDVKKIRDAVRFLTERQGMFTGVGYHVKNDEIEAPSFVVGVNKQCQEVKSRLLQKGVSVTVVSGPGGCGKTTLVKKICNDPEIKGKFNKRYFFIATQSFNVVPAIQKMCYDNGLNASNIQTESSAFNALKEVLAKVGEHPILLVLDDVWSESMSLLEKFVIHDIQDYKIMVTSRFEFPSFGSPVRLEPLNHDDAKDILLNAAATLTGNLCLPDDDIIDEIVRKCKGLPLALKVVGKSLSGCDPSTWKSRLSTWGDGNSILDSDREILNCLQKSLVDLSSKYVIKDCFLDLGSFPEDHKIPACALIDMWAELHNLDDDGMHAMYILHELSTRSLVELVIRRSDEVGDNEGYEDQTVIQHDLLRKLAIYQSSQEPIKQRKRLMLHIHRNTFPQWWKEQMEQPVNANLLSISTDELFSATWPDMEVHAVEVFVLNFCTQNYTLPNFMERMTRLKALIVANNSFFPAVLTNIALLTSLSNLKRVRLERIRIPFLQMESIQLKNLQKISLFMCDISKKVQDFEIQIHDAIPNLLEISVAYCKNLKKLPAQLCDVISLRKISITNCPDLSELPQTIGNLSNLEILRLNACTNLKELPDDIVNLKNLRLLDISDCIEIEDLPYKIGRLHNLKEFHMKGWLKLHELPPSVKDLRNLRKVTCHESKASLWNPFKLSNLKVEVVKEEISLNWLQNSR